MKEIKKKKISRPVNLELRIAKTKKDARQRIVTRGKVEFRLDADIMKELLDAADQVRVPYGVFARMLMIKALKTIPKA